MFRAAMAEPMVMKDQKKLASGQESMHRRSGAIRFGAIKSRRDIGRRAPNRNDFDGRHETVGPRGVCDGRTHISMSRPRQVVDLDPAVYYWHRAIAISTFVFLVVDHLQQRFDVFEFFFAFDCSLNHVTRFGFGVSKRN